MKYIILENTEILVSVLDYLVEKVGLPSIQRRLNIYPEKDDGLQIEAANNKVYFRDSYQNKFVYVKNKNLKHLFKTVQSNKTNKFLVNDIVLIKFANANVLFETFHGNFLSTSDDALAESICKKFGLSSYNNINDHHPANLPEAETLFDEIGNLNSKIKNYAIKTGLDIRSASASIRIRLSNLSNDYTHIEKYFKMLTKGDLLSFDSLPMHGDRFKNMSIIIPVYNQNVCATLLALQGQKLSKADKKKIQVIVVDDGSNSVVKDVEPIRDKLDYELNIISFNNNMGLSNARNAGLSIAKHDLLLFIDSDIVLSKNYLYDINMRLQIVPNAIFVAMRKNIDKADPMLNEASLLKGVDRCFDFDDSRVITRSKEYHIGWDKAFHGEKISILDDTNYFKQLGFGSRVGIYDLSTVVTGHNMAINRRMIPRYPVFSTRFRGWGMEDAYFASTIISNGSFVIPVLSSCVYHIDHPPRSGSMEQKAKEAAMNHAVYNQMLDEDWEV